MYKLGSKSIKKLSGVHPDLVKVVKEAITTSEVDFGVVFGVRTAAEQHELYLKGRTKPGSIVTYKDGYKNKSNHQPKEDGYGYSVDLAVWTGVTYDWNDIPKYRLVAKAMLDAAKKLGIKIRWGADWDMDGSTSDERFLDWGHFELWN